MEGPKVIDIPRSFGALLIGGIISVLFTGITWSQCVVYSKLFPKDRIGVKAMVFGVWLLDTLHSVFITISIWNYFIVHFGNAQGIDHIPTSLALTIVATAILTFVVHLFFIYRVFILAKRNYYIACPIVLLACLRLAFACLTTSRLIELRSLIVFVDLYSWSFTTGLSLSAVIDVLITSFMCYHLRKRREQFSSLNQVLDTLILYAFENGVLTTVAALVSLILWLTMNHNLIFLATHFVIIKFYANNMLATLNARYDLQQSRGITMHSTNLGFREDAEPSSRVSDYGFATEVPDTDVEHFGFASQISRAASNEGGFAEDQRKRREMDEIVRAANASGSGSGGVRRMVSRPPRERVSEVTFKPSRQTFVAQPIVLGPADFAPFEPGTASCDNSRPNTADDEKIRDSTESLGKRSIRSVTILERVKFADDGRPSGCIRVQ